MADPTPLDPDSPRGRQMADDLSRVFAEVQVAILARRAAAQLDIEDAPPPAA